MQSSYWIFNALNHSYARRKPLIRLGPTICSTSDLCNILVTRPHRWLTSVCHEPTLSWSKINHLIGAPTIKKRRVKVIPTNDTNYIGSLDWLVSADIHEKGKPARGETRCKALLAYIGNNSVLGAQLCINPLITSLGLGTCTSLTADCPLGVTMWQPG